LVRAIVNNFGLVCVDERVKEQRGLESVFFEKLKTKKHWFGGASEERCFQKLKTSPSSLSLRAI
jgi:hypothetical protein